MGLEVILSPEEGPGAALEVATSIEFEIGVISLESNQQRIKSLYRFSQENIGWQLPSISPKRYISLRRALD